MSLASTTVLALSMSADAFAVSIGKGVSLGKTRLKEAAKTGLVFGLTEACAPIIGWLLGSAASSIVEAYDHWAAFIILSLIGLHMIFEGIRNEHCEVEISKPKDQRLALVFLTAVGTSIDSMAVGVSLAFMAANIWVSALSIGVATFCMSTLGLMIGHHVGCRLGRIAELLGGLGLLAIGGRILLTHLQIL